MSTNIYRQNKNIIFRQEQDEAMLFNPENSDIWVINTTGCFIWSLCDGKNTEEDIVSKMLDEFNVDEEKAKKDLAEFVTILEKRNFVEKIK